MVKIRLATYNVPVQYTRIPQSEGRPSVEKTLGFFMSGPDVPALRGKNVEIQVYFAWLWLTKQHGVDKDDRLELEFGHICVCEKAVIAD